MFGYAGATKVFNTGNARESMDWMKGRTDNSMRFIGTAEMLGALGMVLPMLTGILSWLTPLAGMSLSLIQIGNHHSTFADERV